MKIEIKENTDLFSLDVDAIGHGVNCMGLMGAGIALKFRLKYPEMYKEYQQLCLSKNFDLKVLAGRVQIWEQSKPKVINLFTQYQTGRHAKVEYIESALRAMLFYCHDLNSIALPAIGCGIGGLKWDEVLGVITKISHETDWNGTLYIALV